jgi:hypothetical protein
LTDKFVTQSKTANTSLNKNRAKEIKAGKGVIKSRKSGTQPNQDDDDVEIIEAADLEASGQASRRTRGGRVRKTSAPRKARQPRSKGQPSPTLTPLNEAIAATSVAALPASFSQARSPNMLQYQIPQPQVLQYHMEEPQVPQNMPAANQFPGSNCDNVGTSPRLPAHQPAGLQGYENNHTTLGGNFAPNPVMFDPALFSLEGLNIGDGYLEPLAGAGDVSEANQDSDLTSYLNNPMTGAGDVNDANQYSDFTSYPNDPLVGAGDANGANQDTEITSYLNNHWN